MRKVLDRSFTRPIDLHSSRTNTVSTISSPKSSVQIIAAVDLGTCYTYGAENYSVCAESRNGTGQKVNKLKV